MSNSNEQRTWVVVGTSRGIGHEFVRQLLERGHRVIATVRANSTRPTWLAHPDQCIYDCDMLSEPSINEFANQLRQSGLTRVDDLVLNAGVLQYPNVHVAEEYEPVHQADEYQRASEISYDDFALHLHTNAIGPIICAQRVLQTGISVGRITFISSDSGSAQCFRDFEDGFAAYGASKAALNIMLRHMAAELKRKGSETTVIALHPGEVKTDMANVDLGWDVEGQISPMQSVSDCIKVIEGKNISESGTFWTWQNEEYPW